MVTLSRLQESVSYNPSTGIFVARVRRGKILPGVVLGWAQSYGRLKISLDGKEYMAHRLAWLYFYGKWPSQDINHINGNPADNRICNLRLATDSQNLGNMRKPITNKSGKKGVSWHGGGQKWQAHIRVEGVNHYLGLFRTVDEAHAAYCEAAEQYRGEFARGE